MRKLLILCCLFLTQTLHATTFGPLANFDVVNDTGKVAHGFEIEIRDIHKTNITSIFGDATRWPNMERYGVPTVTEFTDVTGFGVRIRYQDISKSTPSGTLPVSPNDSCWPLGAAAYGPNYPCDHFGVSTNVNTPNVKYSWLVEPTPGDTNVILETATVPNPNWTVVVPAPIPQPPINNVPQPPIQPPPVVNVVVRAPEPVEIIAGEPQFGIPRWVKATATGVGYNVAVEDLVAENKVIQDAEKNVQVEWQLLQTDPGNQAAGQIDLSGIAPDPGYKSIVYRFEYYKYTGPVNAIDNQAQPVADTYGAPNSPPANELGDFVVANNVAVNFDGVAPPAPPLPGAVVAVPPVINAVFTDGVVGTQLTQSFSITPENAADILTATVTGLPGGVTFDNVNTISGKPTLSGSYPIIIDVSDTTNNTHSSLVANLVITDPVVVAPTPCSGSAETIFNLGRAGWFATATNRVIYPDQAHTTFGNGMAPIPPIPGMLGTFANGDIVSYSGALDQAGVFCVASTMAVSHVVSLNPVTFPNGQAGIGYTPTPVSTVGGFAPAITVAGLPNGLTFDGTNVIGSPTQSGTFTLTITATDAISSQIVIDSSHSITILPAPAVNVSAVLNAGTVGTPYTANVSTSGGIGSIGLTQSGLPSGLQLIGNIISGTPLASGPFNVVLTGTDSFGTIGTANVSFVINPAVVVPPPVNTCPISGVKSVGQFKVVAVGASSITMSNGAVVNYLPCTTISWNRKLQVFKVGDSVEWKAFIVNGSIVATKLTVN